EQEAYNLAVRDYGAHSPEAVDAAGRLATANYDLRVKTQDAAIATKTLGDNIVDTSQKASAAANANVAYEQAVLNLKQAHQEAAVAVREHGSRSDEAQAAFLRVSAAELGTADAARRKAEADATATGATNAAEIGAQAYKDELYRLASQASGPSRDALLAMANGTDTAKQASATAEIQARLHKDELQRLADESDGPLRAALLGAKGNFDNLGGAHANAEQKARAQKDELQRLANTASGPVRAELQRMADQINTLPNKTVFVTVNGQMGVMTGFGAIGGPELVRMAHGGALGGMVAMGRDGLVGVGYDAGGVLPGYSPGRDVHTFVSPTGGVLRLSGGEAIMRPEWAQAVGVGYVERANNAARAGRLKTITDFIGAPPLSAPRWSSGSTQSFAGGGMVLGGSRPFADMPVAASIAASLQMSAKMYPLVMERIKALVDYLSGGPGALAGLAWARTQVGKPYIWGATGPSGYDCSGFMSAIVNVMRGANPYSRVGSTASFPWPGFIGGSGAGLNIGAFKGNPGHMAGTVAGVNVESAGSVGVRVGGPVGANHPMFSTHAYLPGSALGGSVGANLGGGEVQAAVQRIAAAYGWGSGAQWAALVSLVQRESGWNPNAANPTSSARGLFQKMTSVHGPLEGSIAGQAAWGLNYIRSRYGSPAAAWAHEMAVGWYGDGGIVTRPTFGLLGESGPEAVVPLSPSRSRAAAGVLDAAGIGGGGSSGGNLVVQVTSSPYATAERIIATAMHQARLNRLAGRYSANRR
ncbi:MAG TPA: hypothetical protein VFY38_06445, partial [Pseudonocardia sp.]|nr:hypothetical protein [Pseudonocardia sp.]